MTKDNLFRLIIFIIGISVYLTIVWKCTPKVKNYDRKIIYEVNIRYQIKDENGIKTIIKQDTLSLDTIAIINK